MRNVLAAFVTAVGLTLEHRKELLEHRQLPEAYLAGKFASGTPELVSDALQEIVAQGFTETELRRARLVDTHGQPQAYLVDDRILIAYLDERGDVFHLRGHKYGPKHAPLEVFGRQCLAAKPSRVVIVEGEFGAAALLARCVPALAVPGVSSFVGKRYEDMLEVLRRAAVQEVVVCFDNEDKVSERLPSGEQNERFKPDVAKRYDVERCAIVLANRLNGDGITTAVASLPADWRDESGKVDMDGALRLGHSIDDLLDLFDTAVATDAYLAHLPAEAQQVVRHHLCEGEPRYVDGVFKLRRGRLCVEARPAGRRQYEVSVWLNYRLVYTDHGRLVAAAFRKRFSEGAGGHLATDEATHVGAMLDALALEATKRKRRGATSTSGLPVPIGNQTAVIKEDGLWLLRSSGGEQYEERVANFTLEVIEDRFVDDGIEPRRELVGVVQGPEGRSEVVLPASVMGSPTEFTKALFERLGSTINIYGKRGAAEVVIQTALEASQPITKRIVRTHGWGSGDLANVYLTPTASFNGDGLVDAPGLTVSLEGERIAERLGLHWIDDQDLSDLGRHLLADFLDQHERCVTVPLLGHVFLAPVVSKLGSISWPLLQLRGQSGTRKTTLARLAQSFFGAFSGEDALETWRSTPNAIQRSGHYFRDALFTVDDLKNDNIDNHRGVRALLQLYADRGSRGRLHRSATKHGVSYAIRGLLLVTGEDSIDDRASIAARRLTLEVGDHDGLEAGRRCIEESGRYPGLMGRFVSWLANFGFELPRAFHKDLMDELGADLRGLDNAPRIVSNLAANGVGFYLLLSFLADHDVIDRHEEHDLHHEHLEILRALGRRTASAVREMAGTDLFLHVLRELLDASEVGFARSRGGGRPDGVGRIIGVDEGSEHVLLFFDLAFAAVEDLLRRQGGASIGLGKRALRDDLQHRGYITPGGQRKYEGERPRVWRIERAVLGLDTQRVEEPYTSARRSFRSVGRPN